MRKPFTILALLGLAVGISPQGTRADGITYTVTSTYASDTSTTSVSAPGATFTFLFTVPSTVTDDFSHSGTNGFVNTPTPTVDVTFCSTMLATSCSPGLTGFTAPAILMFNPVNNCDLTPVGGTPVGGLFSLAFANGFDWEFMGPQMFTPLGHSTLCAPGVQTASFLTGPFTIIGGTGFPVPTNSFFFDVNDMTVGGDLTGGSVSGKLVSTPEPSSLLLLGGGFLALGGFARKRLIARFN